MILSIPDSSYLKKVAIEPEINGLFEDCFQMIISFEERGGKKSFHAQLQTSDVFRVEELTFILFYFFSRDAPPRMAPTPDFKVALLSDDDFENNRPGFGTKLGHVGSQEVQKKNFRLRSIDIYRVAGGYRQSYQFLPSFFFYLL